MYINSTRIYLLQLLPCYSTTLNGAVFAAQDHPKIISRGFQGSGVSWHAAKSILVKYFRHYITQAVQGRPIVLLVSS